MRTVQARLLYRLEAYARLSLQMLRCGVPAAEIARHQFPFAVRDPRRPILLELELTNVCNLRCVYCTSPLGLRPRGFMHRTIFDRALAGIEALGINRVRVIGNGEPTLHPQFAEFIRQLAGTTPFLAVLTNAQWRRPDEIVDALVQAPVQMIEVSVDGIDKIGYEAARIAGRFEALLANLETLQRRKRQCRSSTVTNLRVMMRPSERSRETEMKAFWRKFADTVMPQYVFARKALKAVGDSYEPLHHSTNAYPRCSQPFNGLQVEWNGNVPLCSNSVEQAGPPGLLLGNLEHDSLPDLWNSPTMRAYRHAHRTRSIEGMPICRGCTGS